MVAKGNEVQFCKAQSYATLVKTREQPIGAPFSWANLREEHVLGGSSANRQTEVALQ